MKLLTLDDFPKDIVDALIRVRAWQKLDEVSGTLTIFSRNSEYPLSNREKIRISNYLIMQKHLYKKVSFRKDPYLHREGGYGYLS